MPPNSLPTSSLVLIIEPDSAAAFELAEWLSDRPQRPDVMFSTSVEAAKKCLRTEPVNWLFVRTRCWDEVQKLALGLPRRPRRVVFLSGRRDKGTGSLDRLLDAQLKTPYLPEHLTRIWDRLSSPTYQPQPLDFFFLRVNGQLTTVRYGDLRRVEREGELLRIETRAGDYVITSNLQQFQARLPIQLAVVRPGRLVNEAYDQTITATPETPTE
jgi:hypothetical protein